MEQEQILKKLDWLDEERRKDKTRLAALEERLEATEGNIPPLVHQTKDLNSELTRLVTLMGRMDQFDEHLMQARIESKQYFEELERQFLKKQDENEKVRRVEIRGIEGNLTDLRKELEQIPEIKRQLKVRVDEEARISRLINEMQTRIESVRRSEDEYTRSYRLLEDGRRQDTKRITDLTGEVSAIQKRLDEQRGRVELNATSLRKLETRVNENTAVETERREAQASFLESQALYLAERERQWKEWQVRFELIESQATDVETSLQSLDATNRAIKATQQNVEDTTQKVERRINEITEIQRLAEERFRQEWVTFRADDQKRWVNYTLTLDEQKNEYNRQFERINERTTSLTDQVQILQDLIQQTIEGIEKRLQAQLAMTHEWVASHERSLGRTSTGRT